jgi:hypothetical protein
MIVSNLGQTSDSLIPSLFRDRYVHLRSLFGYQTRGITFSLAHFSQAVSPSGLSQAYWSIHRRHIVLPVKYLTKAYTFMQEAKRCRDVSFDER